MENKKRIISGITSTGKMTIGNYLGAIKQILDFQKTNKYQIFIFVADLHALTIYNKPEELAENRKDIYALFLASGIDVKKNVLFFQSDVSEHSQLAWVLENNSSIGKLSRMIQFKEKQAKNIQSNNTFSVKTGLLTYPILMAADILLYNPDLVTVGKDQKQHLELTKSLANRFNNLYGKTFKIPEIKMSESNFKILSLIDPSKKMSKSDSNPNSYIALLDDPEIAYKKIQKAVTDSENKISIDWNKKPGVTNLISIYAGFNNLTLKDAQKELKKNCQNYGDLKKIVGETVKQFLKDIQIKYKKFLPQVNKLAQKGKIKASKEAEKNLKIIYQKIGLSN